MACPRSEIQFRATDTEIHASFKGPLDQEGGQLLRSLADRSRQMSAQRVTLDVREMNALEPPGVSALLQLEQSVAAGRLDLNAGATPAAEMLVRAGLARLLRS